MSNILEAAKAHLATSAELLKPLSREEENAASKIENVVVPLGPYRNLTTQTAAIFALHPNAIVLNHAGSRILSRQSLDWVRKPNPQRLESFVRAAVRLSQGGKRGGYGGNILLSHAFDDIAVRGKYQRRFGDKIIKDRLSVLFWKESMRVTDHMIQHESIHNIMDSLPSVRMLVPVRNPIDCAKSNIVEGHWKKISDAGDFDNVLDRIVEIYCWIWSVHLGHQNRFLFLWEYDDREDMLRALARFAALPYDTTWASDVIETLAIRPKQRTEEEIDVFEDCVVKHTEPESELRQRLLKFVEIGRQ